MTNKLTSRRNFLKRCAIAHAAGYTGAFSALGGLSLTAQAQSASIARPTEYRAMVCIYLTGGNDLNMLIPTDDTRYNQYAGIRGDLAIERASSDSTDEAFIPISSNGTDYGLHPSCGAESDDAGSGGIKKLYDQDKLAFIANTGALIQPTTYAQYSSRDGNSVPLPPSLFNHLIQKDFVRAGKELSTDGWAGRIADYYDGQDTDSPLNLSFTGDNVWQRGIATSTYGTRGASISPLYGYRNEGGGNAEAVRRNALDRMNRLPQSHTITKEVARIVDESFELSDSLRSALATADTDLQTEFPNTDMGARLENVAKLIKARSSLGMPQQTFYVDSPGWDMHDDLISEHASNLEELSAAMAAFYSATIELGLENNIVTFTNSDFGRTLDPNSTGSDHAWGGSQIVMGGKVAGGQVYGDFPYMANGNSETQFIEFRGSLIPSISTDQVSSTIAKWFGDFSNNTLEELFPNLHNFNSYDLGFIS